MRHAPQYLAELARSIGHVHDSDVTLGAGLDAGAIQCSARGGSVTDAQVELGLRARHDARPAFNVDTGIAKDFAYVRHRTGRVAQDYDQVLQGDPPVRAVCAILRRAPRF